MIEDNSFANILKTFRMRKGKEWTQKKTALLLGISHRKYVGWENRESLPDDRELKEIVALFDLNEKDKVALYDAAARVAPKIDNLAFPRNRFFTGREEQLKRIEQFLKDDGTQPVSICGLGGVGKTQLALEYAHRGYREVYRTVLWVNAANETIGGEYGELADLLELPEREPDRRIQAVKTWLNTHTGWLLILDNVDDLKLVRSFLPTTPGGHILLTMRSQVVGNVARQIEIEGMEPEKGQLFLLTRAGIVRDETKLDAIAPDVRDMAMQLVRFLGGLPLALDQAGAYIEETGASLADYIQLYHEKRRDLLHRRGSSYGDHPDAITMTVELSVRKACEHHPMAADLLHFCAFLQPDAIPEEVLQQADGLKLDMISLNEVIASLQRYSLIKRNAQYKTFSMHRLVQTVMFESMPPDLRKCWSLYVTRTLNKAFPEVESKDWATCGRLSPHVLVWISWSEDELVSIDEDTFAMEMSQLLAKTAAYIDQYQKTLTINLDHRGEFEPSSTRAGSRRLISLGSLLDYNDVIFPKIVACLNYLAGFCLLHGKYELAETVYKRALAIREHHWTFVHSTQPSVAQLLLGLAIIAHYQGKHNQAEALSQRAFSILEQLVGTTQPDEIQTIKEWYEGFLDNVQEARDALIGFIKSTEQGQLLIDIEPILKGYIFPPAD